MGENPLNRTALLLLCIIIREDDIVYSENSLLFLNMLKDTVEKYVEAKSSVNNLEALETLIDYSYDKLGYFGINSPIDRCFECGFEGDFEPTDDGFECPVCKEQENVDVVKRLCG